MPARPPSQSLTRRRALQLAAAAGGAPFLLLRAAPQPAFPHGVLSGEPTAEKVAARVLTDGGNFVDALVAGALAGAVAAPHQTGIGGYGAS
ncbi:MAG: hypothetical protein ACKODH_11255, partial [Limisphaerales bacterium]